MTRQLTGEQFLRSLGDSGLLAQDDVDAVLRAQPGADAEAVAQRLVAAGKLTAFQAAAVRERRFDELTIGNYQVLDRLGAGGMGTVYKARHRRMKRVVAIKVLSRNIADDKFVQRFQREVEAVARLSHPNIVLAHDADEAAVGHFLVMEFVNGRDLATEVVRRGPLPVSEALACVVQAARALDYAHGQGIIHRDIKPANLLRDVNGVVKVADLGLARFNDALKSPDENSALTQAGTIMGTVDFMPPEQAMGLANTDHRADIYSLGCTLYFLITGKPPYQGQSIMAILLKHRDGPIPSLCAERADVPPALEAVFQRMVAKKPEDRFASMGEVARALEAVAVVAEPSAAPSPAVAGATVEFTGGLKRCSARSASGDASPLAERAEHLLTPHQDTAEPPPSERTLLDRPSSVAGGTVLLVEPSRTQAGIFRGYLKELGFADVVTAASGTKALELRARPRPRW